MGESRRNVGGIDGGVGGGNGDDSKDQLVSSIESSPIQTHKHTRRRKD